MDFTNLKEILLTEREWTTNIATGLTNFFHIPFLPENVAAVIILVISFLAVNALVNFFSKNSNGLIKLLGTGALFWFLWLW